MAKDKTISSDKEYTGIVAKRNKNVPGNGSSPAGANRSGVSGYLKDKKATTSKLDEVFDYQKKKE